MLPKKGYSTVSRWRNGGGGGSSVKEAFPQHISQVPAPLGAFTLPTEIATLSSFGKYPLVGVLGKRHFISTQYHTPRRRESERWRGRREWREHLEIKLPSFQSFPQSDHLGATRTLPRPSSLRLVREWRWHVAVERKAMLTFAASCLVCTLLPVNWEAPARVRLVFCSVFWQESRAKDRRLCAKPETEKPNVPGSVQNVDECSASRG